MISDQVSRGRIAIHILRDSARLQDESLPIAQRVHIAQRLIEKMPERVIQCGSDPGILGKAFHIQAVRLNAFLALLGSKHRGFAPLERKPVDQEYVPCGGGVGVPGGTDIPWATSRIA
jgi:hypothetical protein